MKQDHGGNLEAAISLWRVVGGTWLRLDMPGNTAESARLASALAGA
jgi:hypothetical protein